MLTIVEFKILVFKHVKNYLEEEKNYLKINLKILLKSKWVLVNLEEFEQDVS